MGGTDFAITDQAIHRGGASTELVARLGSVARAAPLNPGDAGFAITIGAMNLLAESCFALPVEGLVTRNAPREMAICV